MLAASPTRTWHLRDGRWTATQACSRPARRGLPTPMQRPMPCGATSGTAASRPPMPARRLRPPPSCAAPETTRPRARRCRGGAWRRQWPARCGRRATGRPAHGRWPAPAQQRDQRGHALPADASISSPHAWPAAARRSDAEHDTRAGDQPLGQPLAEPRKIARSAMPSASGSKRPCRGPRPPSMARSVRPRRSAGPAGPPRPAPSRWPARRKDQQAEDIGPAAEAHQLARQERRAGRHRKHQQGRPSAPGDNGRKATSAKAASGTSTYIASSERSSRRGRRHR